MMKFSLVENARWPPILKIAKPIKSTFCPEWLLKYIWLKFQMEHKGELRFSAQSKRKKKKISELCHGDLLLVSKFSFASMPISQ